MSLPVVVCEAEPADLPPHRALELRQVLDEDEDRGDVVIAVAQRAPRRLHEVG